MYMYTALVVYLADNLILFPITIYISPTIFQPEFSLAISTKHGDKIGISRFSVIYQRKTLNGQQFYSLTHDFSMFMRDRE